MHSALVGFEIRKQPLCEVFTPESFYEGRKKVYLYAENSLRYSCCTGAVWVNENRSLITANFQAGCICLYNYNDLLHEFTLHQVIKHSSVSNLIGVDNVAVSPDGTLLVATVNLGMQVNVYGIDQTSCFINPVPLKIIKQKIVRPHGVRFSHNGYLAYTSIHKDDSKVVIEKIEKNASGSITTQVVSELKNPYMPLVPKSLDFTSDDEYVVIIYTQRINAERTGASRCLIAVHNFDKNAGVIVVNPVCVYENTDEFGGGEDIKLYKDSYLIFSDQVRSRVLVYAFDKAAGSIGRQVDFLDEATSRISFPHGLAISSDDKYLVVTNYGDDKFALYSLVHT